MTKRAFTLLELLVVIALMGFLGTVAVGGYRAMRRRELGWIRAFISTC